MSDVSGGSALIAATAILLLLASALWRRIPQWVRRIVRRAWFPLLVGGVLVWLASTSGAAGATLLVAWVLAGGISRYIRHRDERERAHAKLRLERRQPRRRVPPPAPPPPSPGAPP